MNTLYKSIFLILVTLSFNLFSANELYIKGQATAISATTPTLFDSTCILFVNGEIINNDGLFVNSGGSIEVTKNWTNTVTNNKYQSTGTEKFYGTTEQTISGTMNGTTKSIDGYDNQFYDLKVYRNSTITTTPAKYLTLGSTINVANSIDFESSTPNTTYAGTGANKIVIRTDPASPANIGSYANELYLRNPSASALTNYAAISGNGTVRYVEGKLRRQVDAAATYDFPIGFTPAFKDGMEAFSIKFNAAPGNKSILGFIQDATQVVAYRNVLCDVGTDPGPGNDPFPNCVGGPDGMFDLYYLDASDDLSHEWVANASASATENYNMTLFPGALLDDLSKYKDIPMACSAPYQSKLLRVVAKDGIVGGTSQYGPGNWAPFKHFTAYIWCEFPPAATQAISLDGQASFSKFRIHGTNLFSSTALPVELTSLKITSVDNTYFQLNWQTASELNNYGFEVQRSIPGAAFTDIGFVIGNGTTNALHNYTFNDNDVLAETDYYYRLKIIDTDGSFKYSNTLRGRLKGGNSVSISNFYPNPTNSQSTIDVYVSKDAILTATIYDVLGQVVQQEEKNVTQGFNKVSFDFSRLANASYIANFIMDNQKITKKLIKE